MKPNILLATLGGTWQVVPEIAAALAPDRCPLYLNHSQQHLLQEIRHQSGIESIDQLWIITSDNHLTHTGMNKIEQWNQALSRPFTLQFLIAKGTDAVTTPDELQQLRELIFRSLLHATEQGAVVCSLAGGRKTMSADLQRAASLFGARGLLHIVPPEPLPEVLKSIDPRFWAVPLACEDASKLLPAFIGSYLRRETLDTECNGKPAINARRFTLPPPVGNRVWFSTDNVFLVDEVEQREKDAQQLLSNYLAQIAQHEKHENWRHLYRLPPADIDWLRGTMLDSNHRDWIKRLPKAELHCHLGGILTLEAQIQVGHQLWRQLDATTQRTTLEAVAPLLNTDDWPWEWPTQYLKCQNLSPDNLSFEERANRAAALLTQTPFETLHQNLYAQTEPRFALKESAHGFSAYERPGELSGSALLGHSAALSAYADAVRQYAEDDTICYLELRGSPHKYSTDPVAWLKEFRAMLPDTATTQFRFIWIIDRRAPEAATHIIQHVVDAFEQQSSEQTGFPLQECGNDGNNNVIPSATTTSSPSVLIGDPTSEFLVGLDLAGDEGQLSPQEIAPLFLPAFELCMPITIHAGEGETPENIWQAAYHLHADRIGHGLTLAQKPALLKRFRNRDICLEMCPTSNVEVIGYWHPDRASNPAAPRYPFKELWDSGVSVTLNTDNPGICRTTLSDEIIMASRMTGGISLWDTLAIIKQGFVHAMSASEVREKILKKIDKDIFSLVQEFLRANTQ